MYGSREEHYVVYESQIETGNKLLSSVGLISFHGKPRTALHFRLVTPALAGTNEIKVDAGLELEEGDRLVLAATGYGGLESEECFVNSYDNSTGLVALTRNLRYYHFGQAESY